MSLEPYAHRKMFFPEVISISPVSFMIFVNFMIVCPLLTLTLASVRV